MAHTHPSPGNCFIHTFIAFPKITGKVKEFLSNLEHLQQSSSTQDTEVAIEGTVKLHGMHSDLVYDLRDDASEVRFQSRNRICEPNESQQGWPRTLSSRARELSSLKNNIISRFQHKCPSTKIDNNQPLIVAGEWIGSKVQPVVGISSLTNRFVILGIQINGLWQRDSDFVSIEEPSAAIYSVLRVPQFIVTYDIADRSPTNPTLLKMQALSDQVEAVCPYAAHFGISNTRGEGIVWKPAIPCGRANAKYWLKMKGPISDPQNHLSKASVMQMPTAAQQTTSAEQAAEKWVTSRRVEQAFEFLAEMTFTTDGQRERAFTKWIVRDIVTEENAEIEVLARNDLTFEKRLRARIYFRARAAFLEAAEKARAPRRSRVIRKGGRKMLQEESMSEQNDERGSLEHARAEMNSEPSIAADKGATTPELDVNSDQDKSCPVPDALPPTRAPTNEERFLEAMEKMLRR